MIKKIGILITSSIFLFSFISLTAAIVTNPKPGGMNISSANFTPSNYTKPIIQKINVSERNYTYSNASFGAKSYNIKLLSGNFTPEPINSSLNLSTFVPSNYTYYLIQAYNNTISQADYNQMTQDGVILIEYILEDTYLAKFPQWVIENKTYSSLRWIGVLNGSQKIQPPLLNRTNSTNPVNVTVIFFEQPTQNQLNQVISLSNYIVYNGSPYTLIDVEMNGTSINKTANLSFVKFIEEHIRGEALLDRSSKVVAADFVWPFYDSSGVTVGIIDTGIQYNHPHFSEITIYNATDYVDNDTNPEAECNPGPNSCAGAHGVHVAGIISGQSTYNGRTIRGISSKASLVIERTFDKDGKWPISVPDPAFDDIWDSILDLDNDNNFVEPNSPDILSLSWIYGASGFYTSQAEEVDKVVNGELSNGKEIVVVIAAGNAGSAAYTASPATSKNAIAVGASADFRNATNQGSHWAPPTLTFNCGTDNYCNYDPANNYVMEYSQRRALDTRLKPDILAPGSEITSTVINNDYASWDGTSMATPHVAGAAAQIIKAIPNATPSLVKALLVSSAVDGSTTDNKNINKVWGRLDAYNLIYQNPDEVYEKYDTNVVGNALSGKPLEVSYSFYVPSGSEKVVISMAYSDPPGDPIFSEILYNDLDLYLVNPSSQTLYYIDDDINNVEKYVINSPASGWWEARVQAISIDDGFGTRPDYQNYSIVIRVIKPTQTPDTDVNVVVDSVVEVDELANVSGLISTLGLNNYDMHAVIETSTNFSLISPRFDGTDADKDVLGDIAAGNSRMTRTWSIIPTQTGNQWIKITAIGYKENGTQFAKSLVRTISVCMDNDNDNYLSNVCGGNDCNDNNSSIKPGATEVCDGLDNNCNLLIDEGCSCTDGQQQECGTDTGACQKGNQTCSGGQWGSCIGDIEPMPEPCPHDGIDNDCDGLTDENACGGQECYDWTTTPTGQYYQFIKTVWSGPYCSDGYEWHTADVDNDGYAENYMIVNDTYKIWGKCLAQDGYIVNDFINYFDTLSYGCYDGNCDQQLERNLYSEQKTSTSSYITYREFFCKSNGLWWGWFAGDLYWYWDDNGNNQWDPEEHREYGMILNCGTDADCAGDEYCDKTHGGPATYFCQKWCGNGICEAGETCPQDGSGPEICTTSADEDCDGYVNCADGDCGQGNVSSSGFCCGSGCSVNGGTCVDASVAGFTCTDGTCNTYSEACRNGELESSLLCSGTSLSCSGGTCESSFGAPTSCDEINPGDFACENSQGPSDERACEAAGTDCYLEAENICNAPSGCDETAQDACSANSGLQCEWQDTYGDNVVEECESTCGAISQCDEQFTGYGYTSCTTAGQSYFADQCSSTCQGQERTDNICRSSAFAAGCTAASACNGIVAGTGNCTLNCQLINTPPSIPTSITCNSGNCNNTFSNNIILNCSGSIDNESDAITYFLEAYYNQSGPANWWNNSWNYRKQLTITNNNNSAALERGTTINVTFDHSELVSQGRSLANGSDIRILLHDSLELDFINLTRYNQPNTTLMFKLQSNISASGSNNSYSLYYTNSLSNAIPARNEKKNIFEEFDNFNDSSINSTLWKSGGNAVETTLAGTDGVIKIDIGGAWGHYLVSNRTFPYPVTIISRQRSETADLGFTGGFGFSENDSDASWSTTQGQRIYGLAFREISTEMQTVKGQTNISSVPYTFGNWIWGRIDIDQNASAEFWIRNDSTLEWTRFAIDASFGNFFPKYVRMDNTKNTYYNDEIWIIRSIRPYPSTTLGSEEVSSGSPWKLIGNHTHNTTLNWNISAIQDQSGVSLKCRSIDLQGSNSYSPYFQSNTTLTITNLINDTIPLLNLSNLRVVYTNSTQRVFRFHITNLNSSNMSNISWTLNTGSSIKQSLYNTTLKPNETIFVLIYHNYTIPGNYTITATAQRYEISDSETIQVNV